MPLWPRRRSSTMHTPYSPRAHGPSETLLHGWDVPADETQRTVNTLVPHRRLRRSCALRALCAPFVLSSSPFRLPTTARIDTPRPVGVALVFPFRLIFSDDSSCISLPRTHNGSWQSPRYGRREKREKTYPRTWMFRRVPGVTGRMSMKRTTIRRDYFDARIARYFILHCSFRCGLWFPRSRFRITWIFKMQRECSTK